ncbi:5890_t:CDS:1 [Entrophospora sp. SA101]|nr:5890_t:CDS:1 [Entrophospora sp. SA101]
MANVRTLQDTKSMESKKIQGQGYRLGSAREQELEEALRDSIKSNSELIDDFKNLQVVYSKFSKNIKQGNAQLQRNLKQADTDIQQIHSHALQLISEIKRLRKEISVHKSQNNRQQIAMNDYDIKLDNIQNALSEKSKEAKSLQTKVKKLGGNLTSAQKNSSMKESEVLFLKSKLAELEKMKDELSLKVSELEHLKSDAISRVLPLGEAISGGGEGSSLISSAIVEPLDLLKKNIANSDVISAVDKPKLNFSKFLKRRNNMDQTEKIDTPKSSDTIIKANISESTNVEFPTNASEASEMENFSGGKKKRKSKSKSTCISDQPLINKDLDAVTSSLCETEKIGRISETKKETTPPVTSQKTEDVLELHKRNQKDIEKIRASGRTLVSKLSVP